MKNITLSLLSLLSAAVLFSCSSAEAFSQVPDDRPQEPAEEQQSERISAVFLADTQIGFFDSNKSYTQDSLNLELAVAKINQLKPDFVVVNGDMVNSSGSKNEPGHYLYFAL